MSLSSICSFSHFSSFLPFSFITLHSSIVRRQSVLCLRTCHCSLLVTNTNCSLLLQKGRLLFFKHFTQIHRLNLLLCSSHHRCFSKTTNRPSQNYDKDPKKHAGMPFFKKSLAGPGYIVLNVIRVMNIIALLAVVAASFVMLVKTFVVSKFFFFDGVTHLITGCVSSESSPFSYSKTFISENQQLTKNE